MDAEEKLKIRLEQIARLKKIKVRFDKLFKKTGSTYLFFCNKYGFDNSTLSHRLSGRRGASKEYVDKLDKCLKKEGV